MARSIGFNPELKTISASFTRPANTTAYTAGDAVGTATTNVLSFARAVNGAGGGGEIVKAVVISDNETITNKSLRLHFYSAAPTAIADNAVNTVLSANAANYLGYVDTGTLIASASDSHATKVVDPPLPFTISSGSTLYCALEAVGGFTPASAEVFTVKVTVRRYT